MNEFWSESLSEEASEELLQKLASKIAAKRMETPAILFLEMHKPLGNVGAHAMIALSPFIIPFVGFDNVNDVSRLMSNRENWNRLIDLLDARRSSSNQEQSA
ncbi:MAG: hypothetical protein JNM85_10410 [Chthonomonas sp.]|nr:hypothetical protein [Chthonomonas sp.]